MKRPTCKTCPMFVPVGRDHNLQTTVYESFCQNTMNNFTNENGVRRTTHVSEFDSCQHHPDMPVFMVFFRVQRIATAFIRLVSRARSKV